MTSSIHSCLAVTMGMRGSPLPLEVNVLPTNLGSDVSAALTSSGSRNAGDTSSSSNTSSCVVFHSEKKCYRESYISDPLEQDLNPHSRNYLGNEDNMGSRQQSLLSLFPKSHGKSHTVGMELNSLHGECEMSVDELTGTERLCGMAPSSSSWSSFSSQDTCTNNRGELTTGPNSKSLSWPMLI